jgi:hypothetical protein
MKYLTVGIDTGSGTGTSYYGQWHYCPRKRYLDDLRIKMGLTTSMSDNENFAIGSVWHALMRIYFEDKVGRGFDTQLVRFAHSRRRPWAPAERARIVGERLFKDFRVKYPQDIFGKPTAVEKLYKATKAPWLPEGMILTGRMDLETYATKNHAKRIFAEFGLPIEPGEYIVDHKSSGGPRFLNSYEWSIQFVLYQLLRRKKGIKGLLANVGIKSNPSQFRLIYIPPPSQDQVKMATEWLLQAKGFMSERPARCHAHHCYDYGSAQACPYGVSGECRRF